MLPFMLGFVGAIPCMRVWIVRLALTYLLRFAWSPSFGLRDVEGFIACFFVLLDRYVVSVHSLSDMTTKKKIWNSNNQLIAVTRGYGR